MIVACRLRRLALALSLSVMPVAVFAQEPSEAAVLDTYADIALANYEDALTTAQALDKAVDALIAGPSEETLTAAREAWKASRVPYQQTEAFRFGNPIVDEWEGRVNAWPLDEGLIDYVDAGYRDHPGAAAGQPAGSGWGGKQRGHRLPRH
jgi:putative iron-regulated protein